MIFFDTTAIMVCIDTILANHLNSIKEMIQHENKYGGWPCNYIRALTARGRKRVSYPIKRAPGTSLVYKYTTRSKTCLTFQWAGRSSVVIRVQQPGDLP
jgi:hypothetical protein